MSGHHAGRLERTQSALNTRDPPSVRLGRRRGRHRALPDLSACRGRSRTRHAVPARSRLATHGARGLPCGAPSGRHTDAPELALRVGSRFCRGPTWRAFNFVDRSARCGETDTGGPRLTLGGTSPVRTPARLPRAERAARLRRGEAGPQGGDRGAFLQHGPPHGLP